MPPSAPLYTLRQYLESLDESERLKIAQKLCADSPGLELSTEALVAQLSSPDQVKERLANLPDKEVAEAVRTAMANWGGFTSTSRLQVSEEKLPLLDNMAQEFCFGQVKEHDWLPLGIGGRDAGLGIFPEVTASYLRSTPPVFKTFLDISTRGNTVLDQMRRFLDDFRKGDGRHIGRLSEIQSAAREFTRRKNPMPKSADDREKFLLMAAIMGELRGSNLQDAAVEFLDLDETAQLQRAFQHLITLPFVPEITGRFGKTFLMVLQSLEPLRWYCDLTPTVLTLQECLISAGGREAGAPVAMPNAEKTSYRDLVASVGTWFEMTVLAGWGLIEWAEAKGTRHGVRLAKSAGDVFRTELDWSAWDGFGPESLADTAMAAAPRGRTVARPVPRTKAPTGTGKAAPKPRVLEMQFSGPATSPRLGTLLNELKAEDLKRLAGNVGVEVGLPKREQREAVVRKLADQRTFVSRLGGAGTRAAEIFRNGVAQGGILPLEKGLASIGLDAAEAGRLMEAGVLFFRPSLKKPREAVIPLEYFFMDGLVWKDTRTARSALCQLSPDARGLVGDHWKAPQTAPKACRLAVVYEGLRSTLADSVAALSPKQRLWLLYLVARGGEISLRDFNRASEMIPFLYGRDAYQMPDASEAVFVSSGRSGTKPTRELFLKGILALYGDDRGEAIIGFPAEFRDTIAGDYERERERQLAEAVKRLYSGNEAQGSSRPWRFLGDLRRLLVASAAEPLRVTQKGVPAKHNLKRISSILKWEPEYQEYVLRAAQTFRLLSRQVFRGETYLLPTSLVNDLLELPRSLQVEFLEQVFFEVPTSAELSDQSDDFSRSTSAVAAASALVTQYLPEADERWLDLPSLSRTLECDPEAVIRHEAWTLSRRNPDTPTIEELVRSLAEALYLLGFVESLHGPENLTGIRFTEVGRLHFGEKAREKIDAIPAPDDQNLIVQPNGDIVASLYLPYPVLAELAAYAHLTSLDQAALFRIDSESIQEAWKRGVSPRAIGEFLSRHATQALPQPVSFLIEDLTRRTDEARVGTASGYVQFADPKTLSFVADLEEIKGKVEARSDDILILKRGTDLDSLSDILVQHGLLAKPSSASSDAVVPVVRVSASLGEMLSETAAAGSAERRGASAKAPHVQDDQDRQRAIEALRRALKMTPGSVEYDDDEDWEDEDWEDDDWEDDDEEDDDEEDDLDEEDDENWDEDEESGDGDDSEDGHPEERRSGVPSRPHPPEVKTADLSFIWKRLSLAQKRTEMVELIYENRKGKTVTHRLSEFEFGDEAIEGYSLAARGQVRLSFEQIKQYRFHGG